MKNRRNTIVINSKFQYLYALMSVAASILMLNLFVIVSAIFPGTLGTGFYLSKMESFVLALFEVLMFSLVWYGSLRSSHRVAGPVYVFSREIERLGQGDLTRRIKLRQHDAFQETADIFNISASSLEERVGEIKAIAREIEKRTDGGDEEGRRLAGQLLSKLADFRTEADGNAESHDE